jgi:hypothetical protein
MEKNPEPGFNFSFGLKILKFFYADPDQGSCQPGTRDRKNRIGDPGSGKNISDLQQYSDTVGK